MTRRRVVVRPEFFDRLEELLPEERSPSGEPSTTDFVLHDLTAVIDTLAAEYLGRTMPTEETDVRILVAAGVVVPFVVIYVREVDVDTVEILWIDFES